MAYIDMIADDDGDAANASAAADRQAIDRCKCARSRVSATWPIVTK